MTSNAIATVVLVVAACAPNPQSWEGFPLPPKARVVKEIDVDFGTQRKLLLAIDGPEQFDEIVAFYDTHLPTGWERCPSSDIDWPDINLVQPERHVRWSNPESRQLFWVITAELSVEDAVDGIEVAQLIAVSHHSDPVTWELFYRGICAPRNRELFSPMAIHYSRLQCTNSSRESAFDAEAWHSADERARGLMTDDLICRGLLLGLNEQEVIDLLGPPDGQNNGTFSYRVHLPVSPPDLPGSREEDLGCPESEGELQFDFTVEIPSEAEATFWIANKCWADGT